MKRLIVTLILASILAAGCGKNTKSSLDNVQTTGSTANVNAPTASGDGSISEEAVMRNEGGEVVSATTKKPVAKPAAPKSEETESKEPAGTLEENVPGDESSEIIQISGNDDGIPGGEYDITIDPASKILHVKMQQFSSAPDVQFDPEEYETTLSEEELMNILAAYEKLKDSDREIVSLSDLYSALESIARDAEVFSDTSDPQWENEKEYDTDGDGTITRREFGLLYLADILIELN